MSRRGPSSSRAPARVASPRIERDAGSATALRLAIGKDGLGIELARPAAFACLDVVDLVVRLPNVRFPFDVTGGIARFRHRRGELERLAFELDARRAARWAEPQLRGLLAPGACAVTIAPRAFGATVTVLAHGDADPGAPAGAPPRRSAPRNAARALAFEIAIVGSPELALVVHSARGANLPAPATVLAIRALATLLGDAAKREGARFVIARAAAKVARALLPDAGVRAPGGDDVMLAGSGESDGVLFVAFTRGPTAPPLPPIATLANEAALLVRAGDDARFAGDLGRARHHDVGALERAPRHPEIARRIAELDAHAGARAEAAIATLRSADRIPYLGQLLGDLLFEAGDIDGAIAALLREGERDPSAPVAALAFARAAGLAANPSDALLWLDAAIARGPSLAHLRWERARRRLVQGRLGEARADFQELEALASGVMARFEVLQHAAELHRLAGLGNEAAILYERALLYRPEDPDTLAGLGAAIANEGRAARGATLLAQAIDTASTRVPPLPTAWMELELARVLGERLNDRPAAIARLRAVADEAPEAIAARGLEGRYRAALGDAAGASLAFARLRERADREPAALPWLEEAATFEEARGELAVAQAHLAAALAIAPTSTELEARFRAVSERVGRAAGLHRDANAVRARAAPVDRQPKENVQTANSLPMLRADAAHVLDLASAPEPAVTVPPEDDEARIESLTRTLQGDPSNDAVVDELVVRLTRVGRSMELFALLSARLEEAPPERRAQLLPRHREVLEALERDARAAGRDAEADLFRLAREAD